MNSLPVSTLTKSQFKKYYRKIELPKEKIKSVWSRGINELAVNCEIRWDDHCGNGRNTFSITGSTNHGSSGCIHEEIVKVFPEFSHLIKYHLFNSDGPWGYIGNTTYFAGNKDCWGGIKDQPQWYRYDIIAANGNRVFNIPDDDKYAYTLPEENKAKEIADRIGGTVVPVVWTRHEGKEREFDLARDSACWPEATDEQLSLPKEELVKLLQARLPSLMEEFKREVEKLGFVY